MSVVTPKSSSEFERSTCFVRFGMWIDVGAFTSRSIRDGAPRLTKNGTEQRPAIPDPLQTIPDVESSIGAIGAAFSGGVGDLEGRRGVLDRRRLEVNELAVCSLSTEVCGDRERSTSRFLSGSRGPGVINVETAMKDDV